MKHNFQLVSAILRGPWFIQEEWADSHMPMVVNLLEGNPWPDEMATRPKALRVKGFEDDDDDELNDDEDLWLPLEVVVNVAIIGINGPMTKYGGLCSYGTLDYIQAFQKAFSDDRIEAVLLKVDSPGGEVRSIADLYDLVKLNEKPVVAFVEDMAASAAYYAIAGAEHIMAAQATNEIGSIGVYTTLWDRSKQLEKLGITQKSIYSRLSSEKNIEVKQALDGKTKLLEDHLDVLATSFVDAVKTARGDKLNPEAGDPFKGKSFFAKDALAVGLIDEIGTLSAAFDKAQALAAARKAGKATGTSKQPLFNSNNPQSPTDMFGNKFSKLSVLMGLTAAMISDAALGDANAQLKEKGIEGAMLVRADFEQEVDKLQTDLNQANAQVTQLSKDLADAKAAADKAGADTVADLQKQITELTKERDDAKAEAQKLGDQAATDPAKPVKKTETVAGDDSKKSPFLCQADVELAALRQKAQLN